MKMRRFCAAGSTTTRGLLEGLRTILAENGTRGSAFGRTPTAAGIESSEGLESHQHMEHRKGFLKETTESCTQMGYTKMWRAWTGKVSPESCQRLHDRNGDVRSSLRGTTVPES